MTRCGDWRVLQNSTAETSTSLATSSNFTTIGNLRALLAGVSCGNAGSSWPVISWIHGPSNPMPTDDP